MENKKYLIIDGIKVPIEGERNILEVVRKANIEIPTLCYNKDLTIHGSCRLCIVEIEGKGILPSCSTPPQDGMVIKTNTAQIRETRKMIIELLLANHSQNCYTCGKSTACELQKLAKDYGIDEIRFKRREIEFPKDIGVSLVRDPNKCILCGQCVRVCKEIQGIGAIDFSFRGSDTLVLPAFGKSLDNVECVRCGQCVQVCPTGALMIKSDISPVWKILNDKTKKVAVQIAPAVRAGIGEEFGFEPGVITTGKMVTALKKMGFDYVFDTCFSADLTILEEATEFVGRVEKGGKFPMFTSCCPGWINFVEAFYPELAENLSTCKSPQQMFSAVIKAYGPKMWNVKREDLKVVSIMPCTAKKEEMSKDKFNVNGDPDTDFVITTQEFAQMIKEAGIDFRNLEDTEFDSPFAEKTGAGVIFANSGGVAEAAVRFILDLDKNPPAETAFEFKAVRGMEGIRETAITLNGTEFHLAIVSGLANARKVIENIKAGKSKYHFIEVMTCPNGCISGGGQPISKDKKFRVKRTEGIYKDDVNQKLHKSQDNPDVIKLYKDYLAKPGSHEAHKLLHTHYENKNLKKKYGLEK